MSKAVNLAIFASGSGTNAERIMEFFKNREDVKVSILLSNNPAAYALERAKKFDVPAVVFNKEEFCKTDKIVELLKRNEVEWVVLAGFLWLIPENLIKAFPNRILNIHPALLPNYGGKGMYGANVHKAVIAAGDKESGISIHYINERYDEGEILFQATCKVESHDTPESLAAKIHQLEHLHFPEVIEKLIVKNRK